MSLSATAVRRPIATAMAFVALITLGLFAWARLKVDLFPDLDFPSISVVTTYPGVAPEEIETLITRPIERAVARVENIDRLESFSIEGRSRVALRFDWGVPLEEALSDVRTAVDRVRATLPDDADAPVIFKFDIATFPILNIGLSADMDEAALLRFAENVVQPRLERVSGVASIDIRGARDREIRVQLNAEQMAALGVSLSDVQTALRNENLTVPAGVVEDDRTNTLLRAISEFRSVESVSNALVTTRNGVPIHIRDVADVADTLTRTESIIRVDGIRGVQLNVVKSPDANTIEVADGVLAAVAEFNVDYADQAELTPYYDASIYIRDSVGNVFRDVLQGGALAVLVLLLFLRSVRSTLVIAIAIPISVIGTFFLMDRWGMTLNLISFGGLAVGIGMLVDNSIVILENIFRRVQLGEDARSAAILGSEEVSGAIVSSTLTTVVVFAPVFYLGGFAAVFFTQMALVVTASLLCSLFVSLTLVPILASRMLANGKVPVLEEGGGFLPRVYSRFIRRTLRLWPVALLAAGAMLAATVALSRGIGSELLPEGDEGEVRVNLDYPSGTRIEVTEAAVEVVEAIIAEDVPEAATVVSTIGSPGFWSSSGEETANVRIVLVPHADRSRSSDEIASALTGRLSTAVPGLRAVARPGGGLFILGFIRGGDTRVRVDVRGHDLADSDAVANALAAELPTLPGITDARSSRQPGGPEQRLVVNRERAADLGMTTREIAEAISTLVQGTRAGLYREGGDEYEIVMRLSDDRLTRADDVLSTPLVLRDGRVVRLGDVVDAEPGTTPKTIERLDQERIVTVSGGIDPAYDIGAINASIREHIRGMDIPDGIAVIVAGEGQAQNDAFASLGVGVWLALLLVFMVMAAQFESLTQPLLVMVSVPFAGLGVVGILKLTDTTLNLNSFMGIIVLAGIVVNNAIVLVDCANQLRAEGMELIEATVEASRRRLRPILMTTATTVLGLVPVALGLGAGSENQTPLARVVVGGLTTSTIVTLVLIPVIFVLSSRIGDWLTGRARAKRQALAHDASI